MSKDIKYSIQFYSYWHCGAGLAAGASADALVIKDENSLPFVPGKTIKGLLRECVEEYSDLSDDAINQVFGKRTEDDTKDRVVGRCYFSNATLSQAEREQIVKENLQKYLYKTIAATSIDDKTGTAKDMSLRTIEATISCELQGEIDNVPEAYVEDIKQSLRMIKRLGVNRNRGLGRCDFIIGG